MITEVRKLELEGKLRCTKAQGLTTARGGQLGIQQEGDVSWTVWRCLQSPRGQRTTWNLLKYYSHIHVDEPGRIGKILLGRTGVVSFSLPASSLPPNSRFNLLGESDGNGNAAPSQLPVNPPRWKHLPVQKGWALVRESRSREQLPTPGALLKCSPGRHQLNSQGLGGSISRQRFCSPGFRSSPVPVPGGDGRSALRDPSSGCPRPTSAGKIILFWLSRSYFFSLFPEQNEFPSLSQGWCERFEPSWLR